MMTTPLLPGFAAALASLHLFAAAHGQVQVAGPSQDDAPSPPQAPVTISAIESGSIGTVMQVKLKTGMTMNFCWCPPGSFTMGSPESEDMRHDDEGPVSVTLSEGFWMAQTPCTQTQWLALMGSTPTQLVEKSHPDQIYGSLHELGPDLPMYFVSPEDAAVFCEKLRKAASVPEGWTAALPTEAQWEYACRAGTQTAYSFGDVLRESDASFLPSFTEETVPLAERKVMPLPAVRSYPANAWGLHDMHGSLFQICADWYYDLLLGGKDPTGPPIGESYASRGGDWRSEAYQSRAANRSWQVEPGARKASVGFRPVICRPRTPSAPHPSLTATALPLLSEVQLPAPPLPDVRLNALTEAKRADAAKAREIWEEGLALKEARKYPEAETSFRRALAQFEKVWDVQDPAALATRLHLAQCLGVQGDLAAALLEAKLALALADARRSYKDRRFRFLSPSLAAAAGMTSAADDEITLVNNTLIGVILADMASSMPDAEKAAALEEARVFFDRCLDGHKLSHGTDHPKTMTVRQLHISLVAALLKLPPALRIAPAFSTPDCPLFTDLSSTAKSRFKKETRAALDEADGKMAAAINLFNGIRDGEKEKSLASAALEIYRRHLGSSHSQTLKCTAFFKWINHSFTNREQIGKELRTLITELERTAGKDHAWTNWCRKKLLLCIRSSFDKTEAIALNRTIIGAQTRTLGATHQDTLSSRQDLARLQEQNHDPAGAEKEYAELVEINTRRFGVSSRAAKECREEWGRLLLEHGQPEKALPQILTSLVMNDSSWVGGEGSAMSLYLGYALHLLNRPAEALIFARRAAKHEGSGYSTDKEMRQKAERLVEWLAARQTESPTAAPEAKAAAADPSSYSVSDRMDKIGIDKIKEEALLGDAECQYLNSLLFVGDGVWMQSNPAATFHWALRAAEAGYVRAQNAIANCYMEGTGVAQDHKKAMEWTEKVAATGDLLGMHNLGICYLYGKGVDKDVSQTLSWLEKAAVAGYLPSVRLLAALYRTGEEGVGIDQDTACHWLTVGAEQDDPYCLLFLGMYSHRGEGVPRNPALAVDLFRRAAEQGLAEAQFKLGMAYLLTNGALIQDPQSAYFWLKLAAAQGHKDAKEWATKAAYDLSKASITKATERVKQFKPRGPRPMARTSPSRSSPGPNEEKRGAGIAVGTGFFITAQGHIVTNHHVIKEATEVRVLLAQDQEVSATVVAKDEHADLAILKVRVPDSDKQACLPVASVRAVKLGATVATVGFPNIGVQGFSPKLSKGEIAGLAGMRDDPAQFQISVPLQPGNSGGALVDSKGNVVGVVCAVMDQRLALVTTGTLASNVSYAVKSSLLMNLIESVPGLPDQLAEPTTEAREFEDVVDTTQRATVMVLVKTKDR